LVFYWCFVLFGVGLLLGAYGTKKEINWCRIGAFLLSAYGTD